jgi:hypothetical protein
MKKFILHVFYFLIPILVIIILFSNAIDSFISLNLKKSNIYAQKEFPTWNSIIDGKVNSDIIINGSSRAWVHINPTLISDCLSVSAYNLGIDGHNIFMQDLRTSLLLKNNTKPHLIIHSLDVFTLQKQKELYNSDQILPYMTSNNEIKKATLNYEGYKPIDYEIPLIRYYGKYHAIKTAISMHLTPHSNPIGRIKGYEGQDLHWNTDFDKAKKIMKSYKAIIDKSLIQLFEKYIQNCKTNKIKLIFVYTPEYIEGQNFIENRQQIIRVYKQLSEKYSIPFYDFSQDKISFNINFFYNATHLNKTGSEKLTNQLIDTLNKYEYVNWTTVRK